MPPPPGGDRRGGGGGIGDQGYCAMHRRKRLRADLMPWADHPGRSRCRLQKECHGAGGGLGGGRGGGGGGRDRRVGMAGSDMATCHLHNRRRKMNQMREVRRGVWECLPNFPCRQFGNAPNGRPTGAMATGMRGFSPFQGGRRRGGGGGGRGGRLGPRFGESRRGAGGGGGERPDGSNAAMWAPSGRAGDGTGRRHRGRKARRAGRPGTVPGDRRIWCARHGKRIFASQCEFVQDSCYICSDATQCLSTPLDAPADLLEKGCAELLCMKHHTLRSAGFVELNVEKTGYQCLAGHACRGVTLSNFEQQTAAPIDGGEAAAAAAATGDFVPESAMQPVQGFMIPGAGAADPFAQHSGREAVSSFFV